MLPAECVGWWRCVQCVLVMGLEITTHHHRGTKAATKAWTKAPAAGWRQVEGGDVVQCSGRVQAGEMLSVIMHHQHQAASHASPVCGDLADICVLNIYFRPSINIFALLLAKIFLKYFLCLHQIFSCAARWSPPHLWCIVRCPDIVPTSRSPNLRTILIPTFNPGQWPPAESGAGPRTQDHIIACHAT